MILLQLLALQWFRQNVSASESACPLSHGPVRIQNLGGPQKAAMVHALGSAPKSETTVLVSGRA
jgi:hypothetical protein